MTAGAPVILLVKDKLYGAAGQGRRLHVDREAPGKAKKVVEGVNTFVPGRTMAVVTDWSEEGIRFVFLQKV